MDNQNHDPRKPDELEDSFAQADYIVRKRYRSLLSEYPICELSQEEKGVKDYGNHAQFIEITKLVYDHSESILHKLTTVYHTLTTFQDVSIVLLLQSKEGKVKLYLGAVDTADGNKRGDYCNTLERAILANFPGSKVTQKAQPRVYQD